MVFGDDFILTLFTKDPDLAEAADRAGVDRIGTDLEHVGKAERQRHLNTWISDHAADDLPGVGARLHRAKLFARCNPIHPGSDREIDRLLASGVGVLMLPYFRTVGEADRFVRLVDERALPVLLAETREAVDAITELVRVPGVQEIHFGLNDLRLSLGWPTHFDVLVSDYLAHACDQVLAAGSRLGVGGLGRAGDNDLPIPADLVAAQLLRLGATASLISRVFLRPSSPSDLEDAVRDLRLSLSRMAAMPRAWHVAQRTKLRALLKAQVKLRRFV